MLIFDTILLFILAGFIFYGLFFGLIRTLGSLFGLIIGALVAAYSYLTVYLWVSDLFLGLDNLGKVVVFLLIFSIVNRLVGFLFAILDRAFDLISIIPFLKTINRLMGAIFGFLLGGLMIGLVLYIASKYAILGSRIGEKLAGSELAPYFLKFVEILIPLFPETLKMIQGII